jgi:hypothetical protein
VKVLLVILKFRELPQFREAVKDLKIDKLWIKWYGQITKPDAYSVARDEFLKRTEYTHFLLLTDDVIVQQKDIDQLIEDAKRAPNWRVISGWFNNDLSDHRDDSNISLSLPHDPPSDGSYEAYEFKTIQWIEENLRFGKECIPVWHQGTALTLFTRDVIEDVPFRSSNGCCIDACLSLDLAAKDIRQFVDLRIRLIHLKINEVMAWRISEVGQHMPEVVFEPCLVQKLQ